MTDPITIGALTASALALAGDAALKGAVGAGVKDAYEALKGRVKRWAGSEVKAVEHASDSQETRAVVAEIVDRQSLEEKAVIREFAEQLILALKNSRNVGLDIGRLEALEVQLDSITVTEGVGVRIEDARVRGTFKTGKVTVGKRGKS
jgi:hypothetical protein